MSTNQLFLERVCHYVWVHKFVFHVEKIQNSGFFHISKKKKRLIDRLIKKIEQGKEAEFKRGCNRDKIHKILKKLKIIGKLI